MKEIVISQIVIPALVIVIGTILELVRRNVKSYLEKKADLIEQQRQELIQKIGIDKYNHNVKIAKGIVQAVEQMGKNFNWQGALKKAKATELIKEKTGLNDNDIVHVIEATVAELNKDKLKDMK